MHLRNNKCAMLSINQKIKKISKNESGQAIVEMALILPIVLLLICGTIETGWMCYNQIAITNLSREGARAGIVYSSKTSSVESIKQQIVSDMPHNMQDKLTVDVTYSNAISPREGDVTVSLTYKTKSITPAMGMILNNGEYSLKSSCTMKVE